MKEEEIISITRKGKTIMVRRMEDGTYSAYVNGRNTQWDLTAEDVMRWLGNALEDGSEATLEDLSRP